MHWLAVRPVHYSALGKAESLLIKTDGGLHIGDCEHRGHGAVLFLVEWINLLRHVSPLGSSYFSKAFRLAAGLDNSSRHSNPRTWIPRLQRVRSVSGRK